MKGLPHRNSGLFRLLEQPFLTCDITDTAGGPTLGGHDRGAHSAA
jgi:hypothetical protein